MDFLYPCQIPINQLCWTCWDFKLPKTGGPRVHCSHTYHPHQTMVMLSVAGKCFSCLLYENDFYSLYCGTGCNSYSIQKGWSVTVPSVWTFIFFCSFLVISGCWHPPLLGRDILENSMTLLFVNHKAPTTQLPSSRFTDFQELSYHSPINNSSPGSFSLTGVIHHSLILINSRSQTPMCVRLLTEVFCPARSCIR